MTVLLVIFAALLFVELGGLVVSVAVIGLSLLAFRRPVPPPIPLVRVLHGVTWRHLEVPAIRRRRPTIDAECVEVSRG